MKGLVQFGRWLSISLFVLGLTGYNPAHSSSVNEVGLGEMAKASELVFEGRVVSVDSRWSQDGNAIRTFVTYEVLDVIKGSAGRTVTLSFLGGNVGHLRLAVTDLAMPVPGEKGVYFVESTDREQVNPLYGWSQGHFLLVKDPSGRGELVLTADAQPVTGLEQSRYFGKSGGLSEGVARGVMTGDASRITQALDKQSFVDNLRDLVLTSGA